MLLMLAAAGCIQIELETPTEAQDAHARANVIVLVARESAYRERFGRYAATFGELQPPVDTQLPFGGYEGCSRGYCYALKGTESGYELRAWPQEWRRSGHRSFYADETGIVRYTAQTRLADRGDVADGSAELPH